VVGAGVAPTGASRTAGVGVEAHAADVIIVAIARMANGARRWNERVRMTGLLC
jgi:hypothetical protein